jgi:glycosyltransferase involved in cell wall biosynthesis
VLSWSLLEAMSAACAIVASNTAPLSEVIREDDTGRLVDFFDVNGLVEQVCDLLDNSLVRARLGSNARRFSRVHYDLKTVCLPQQLAWVRGLFSN